MAPMAKISEMITQCSEYFLKLELQIASDTSDNPETALKVFQIQLCLFVYPNVMRFHL